MRSRFSGALSIQQKFRFEIELGRFPFAVVRSIKNIMASGGEDSSQNRPEIQAEEDERSVVRDTEGIFRSFMSQRYQDETVRVKERGEMNRPTASAGPDALEELRSCNDTHPLSQNVSVVVRRLEEISDEVNAKYKHQFKDMADSLSLTPATAYGTFAAVVRELFLPGINWGRIAALLCFGYEIAVTVIHRGFGGGFLRRIIRFVVDFISNEGIARWIAQHGGWVSYTYPRNILFNHKY